MHRWLVTLSLVPITALLSAGTVRAQEAPAAGPAGKETAAVKPAVDPPADFVIGPEDELSIVFWRDKEMSTQVTVRPDGKISLPLLDEVQAAGLTPADLRAHADPGIETLLRQSHRHGRRRRDQQPQGLHHRPGRQARLLRDRRADDGASADCDGRRPEGLRRQQEHPDRPPASSGRTSSYPFNYKEIRKNLHQNIELKPGDTVVVP